MGRSDRQKRRNRTGVSEKREQKKIKESILKVFQARLASPDQGGALLVGEAKKSAKRKSSSKSSRRDRGLSEKSSDDSDDEGSAEGMSGRGRRKRKSLSLSRKKHSKKDKHRRQSERDTAVSRHMKVAHAVSAPQIHDVPKNRVKMFLHGRITQKVGLINTGKKGAPANRGIVIPEHISREVDKEVEKLVQEAEADVQPGGDVDVAERLVLSSISSACSKISRTPGSQSIRHPLSTVNSVESLQHRDSPKDPDCFPATLQVRDTVRQLVVSLKFVKKNLYPGREYLRETQDDLLKLIKQNAPRCATPTRLPVFNNLTCSDSVKRSLVSSFSEEVTSDHYSQGSKTTLASQYSHMNNTKEHAYSFDKFHGITVPQISFASVNPFLLGTEQQVHRRDHIGITSGLGSFKRKRHEAQHVDMNNNVQESRSYTADEGLNTHYSTAALLEHSRKKLLDEIRSYMQTCKDELKHNVQSVKSDESSCRVARDRDIKHIDFFANKAGGDEEFFISTSGQCRHNNTPPSPFLSGRAKFGTPVSPMLSADAHMLIRANEELTVDREVFEPMEIDLRDSGALGLLEKNDMLQNKGELLRASKAGRNILDDVHGGYTGRHSRNNSQCSHCSQCSSDRNSQTQVPTREASYMPSFHDTYYTDHMGTGDLSWKQMNCRSKVEAMDILDYAEEQQRRDSCVDCQGDRSAASDGLLDLARNSPLWRVLGRQTKLPSLPSPEAPKFYPKKMY